MRQPESAATEALPNRPAECEDEEDWEPVVRGEKCPAVCYNIYALQEEMEQEYGAIGIHDLFDIEDA